MWCRGDVLEQMGLYRRGLPRLFTRITKGYELLIIDL
jgi:hypothetical protein